MRTVVALGVLITCCTAALPQGASPVPQGDAELVKPPSLRSTPQAQLVGPGRMGRARSATPRSAAAAGLDKPTATVTGHPVDYGLSFHGAKDPHFYTPTAPNAQEVGSGVTAGVRFGF